MTVMRGTPSCLLLLGVSHDIIIMGVMQQIMLHVRPPPSPHLPAAAQQPPGQGRCGRCSMRYTTVQQVQCEPHHWGTCWGTSLPTGHPGPERSRSSGDLWVGRQVLLPGQAHTRNLRLGSAGYSLFQVSCCTTAAATCTQLPHRCSLGDRCTTGVGLELF